MCSSFIDQPHTPSSGTSYPISNFLSYSLLFPIFHHLIMSINTLHKPNSYTEERKFECWSQAMQVELSALEWICTRQLVDAPPNIKPIGCRWINKVKFHTDDSVERFKARLVDKDLNQIKGLNYFDTHSPIAKMTTIGMVITLTCI